MADKPKTPNADRVRAAVRRAEQASDRFEKHRLEAERTLLDLEELEQSRRRREQRKRERFQQEHGL